MNKPDEKIIKYALVNALWTVLYIILVATFLHSAPRIFENEPNILIPVFMLMLFVFSATITSGLILGRPIIWYLDGKKKEAVTLLGYTMGVFFVAIVAMLFLLYFLSL